MDEDSPDYLVHEIFTQSFWKDHALGKPILGTRDTVKRFERPVVSQHYGDRFAPGNLIVAAAGNLDHKSTVMVMELLKELRAEERFTVIMVTHNREVAAWGDRTIHLDDGVLVREELMSP